MSRCIHGREDTEPCLPCAMAGQNAAPVAAKGAPFNEGLVPLVAACREGLEPLGPFTALIEAAQMMERQRIRAIVFRLLGNEYTGVAILEAIDRG